MNDENKINTIKLDENKSKRIKKLFEICEEEYQSNDKKLKINYNEKVFFKPIKATNNEDFQKIIDVLSQRGENTPINFNLNINNNYYNSNYNYSQPVEHKGNLKNENNIDLDFTQEKKEERLSNNHSETPTENEGTVRLTGMTAYSLSILN